MSDMKCPFCNQELDRDLKGECGCINEQCQKSVFMFGSEELWQELIRTRKVLSDTIKLAEQMLESIEDEGMCSEYYEDELNKIKALKQKDIPL